MPDALVLLTSTVAPPSGVPVLSVRRAEDRRAQYLSAVTAWQTIAADLGARVLVIDSSPTTSPELDGLAAELERLDTGRAPVTLVHHPVHPDQHRLGKGVGEALLLREAARAHLDGIEVVIKCTGRIVPTNLLEALPPERDGITCVVRPDLTWADSRLIVATAPVFRRYLSDLDQLVDEGRQVYLENALARRTLTAIGDGVPFRPFRRLPRLAGQSGSTGRHYDALPARMQLAVQDRLRTHLRSRIPL